MNSSILNGLSQEFKDYFESKKRIVVKIGSQVLLDEKGRLSPYAFNRLCNFSSSLIQMRKEVILVSSGAIAAGKDVLGAKESSKIFTMPEKQAFAACGQPKLMNNYDRCFKKHGIKTAQILLTREDISVRKRFINARNTLNELLAKGVVPVINENDTVSYDEIKFSENDYLSSLASNLACADLLIILSNVNGVYDKNPHLNKKAKLIPFIDDISSFIKDFRELSRSAYGTGGMKSKLYAAFIASQAGIDTMIISGRDKKRLDLLLSGKFRGTFIPSLKSKIAKKKHWLLFGMEKKGEIIVDKGAEDAIINYNKSLLSSGVIDVRGEFKKGEGVYIKGVGGNTFSIGIAGLDSREIIKVKGMKTSEIKERFGEDRISSIIVHKDRLVLAL